MSAETLRGRSTWDARSRRVARPFTRSRPHVGRGTARADLLRAHGRARTARRMFRHACRLGLEGIVSKKVAAPYLSGRCRSWLKVKNPTYRRRGELSQAA